MVKKYFTLSVLILIAMVATVSAAEPVKVLDWGASPVNSSVSSAEDSATEIAVYILNLGKYDVATGSFTADFYLSLKCNSECPAQDFEFMNGRAASIDKIIDEPNEKFYRIQANLNSPVDLQRFPFDQQQLQIILEDKKRTIDELHYTINKEESGVDQSIVFTGWNLGEWNASVDEHHYGVYDEDYSRYTFSIPISRIMVNSIIKTFLPITFIILVMLSSFVLDPDKITTRLAMVGSALVASVMFHVSLSGQIPPVSYLTFADKFMVLTYFVLLLSFALNVWLLELQEQKKTELVDKIHRATEFTMFVVVPLLYIALFIFLL